MKEKELNQLEKDIMDSLEYCNFTDLCEHNFSYKVYDTFIQYFYKTASGKDTKIYYANGVTKGVLLFEKQFFDKPFVIKIPFSYMSESNGYYTSGYYYEGEFCGANVDNGETWNYCQLEYERYIYAQENGLEDFFAKIEYLGRLKNNNYPIYKQDYAIVYQSGDDVSHTHSADDEKKVSEICKQEGYEEFNNDWLSDAFVHFGEKLFYRFLNFVSDVGIEDLHRNNLGYINMRPVLIDFSGFSD